MIKVILLLLSFQIGVILCVDAQDVIKTSKHGFSYYPLEKKYMHTNQELAKFNDSFLRYKKQAVSIESLIGRDVLSSKKDVTDLIQSILNKYDIVLMPNFPIQISEKGLTLNTNQIVLFEEKSSLYIKPNAKTHYALFLARDIKNVKIYNPNLKGDRYKHKSKDGQWGMGIRIFGSSNIQVFNPRISEMWGDGIYIGGPADNPSRNVEIYNAYLDDNRRNAISITSGENIKLYKPIVSNSNGQSPKGGIDIEPNNNRNVINNIEIYDAVAFRNPIYGISLSLGKLAGEIPKNVNIKIVNPIIVGSKYGLTIPGFKENYQKGHVKGAVSITNPKFIYCANSIKEVKNVSNDLLISINNIEVYNNKKGKGLQKNENALRLIKENLKNFRTISLK